MRILPEAVVVEPTCGAGAGGPGGVLVLGDPAQAPSSRAAVASAKIYGRIGAILRRSNAKGRW